MSLCALKMSAPGFDHYRCDKAISLGVNTPNLSKILKCAGNEDLVTIKSEEETDTLSMTFESPSQVRHFMLELLLLPTRKGPRKPVISVLRVIRISSL